MRAYVYVEKGLDHRVCEDVCVVGNGIYSDEERWLEPERPFTAAIADGVGGSIGGYEAARFMAEWITQPEFGECGSERKARKYLMDANGSLLRLAARTRTRRHMATTLTGVLFPRLSGLTAPDTGEETLHARQAREEYGSGIVQRALDESPRARQTCESGAYVPRQHPDGRGAPLVFHAGNTRAYAIVNGSPIPLTRDHTTYARLIRSGSFAQAECCDLNEINCCFGGGDPTLLSQFTVARAPELSVLVLTSDGLHGHMSALALSYVLASLTEETAPAQCAELTRLARRNGSRDDISFCAVFI